MKKFVLMGLAGAATASTLVAAPAQAAQISLEGMDYEVTTITGTFADLFDILNDQPWYTEDDNTSTLAFSARDQVGEQLGFPATNTLDTTLGPILRTPLFAFDDLRGGGFSGDFALASLSDGPIDLLDGVLDAPSGAVNYTADTTLTFAVVAPDEPESVPEPMTLLGLGAVGLVGAGSALKRKQAAKA
jgi:hypothetical protein